MSGNYDRFRPCGDYYPQDELDHLMDFVSETVADMLVLGNCTDGDAFAEAGSTKPDYNADELRTEKKDD